MRPVIISRLLNQVRWSPEQLSKASNEKFVYCVTGDYSIYRDFKRYLKGLTIANLLISIEALTEGESADHCHAIFYKSPSKQAAISIVNDYGNSGVVLTGEGRGVAQAGFHISIFVGKDEFFDFELNLDAFQNSEHGIDPSLFSLGKVVPGEVARRASLMRSLLGYTEWPTDAPLSETFVLCTFEQSLLVDYASFLLESKSIQGKLSNIKQIDKFTVSDGCNALLVTEAEIEQLKKIALQRKREKILIVAVGERLSENGAHYNLATVDDDTNSRFQVNLLAMNETGHKPHYQLLSSAHIVSFDVPLLSQLFFQMLQLTNVPKQIDTTMPRRVCYWSSQQEFSDVSEYMKLLDRQNHYQMISVAKLDELDKCFALITHETSSTEQLELERKQKEKGFLYISQNKTSKNIGAHYNIKTEPNRIVLELFDENLGYSGFTPAPLLRSKGILVGRRDQ